MQNKTTYRETETNTYKQIVELYTHTHIHKHATLVEVEVKSEWKRKREIKRTRKIGTKSPINTHTKTFDSPGKSQPYLIE